MDGQEDDRQAWVDSGKFAVLSLGEFMLNIVDGSGQEFVISRIKEVTQSDMNGDYRLTMEIELVPYSQVFRRCRELGVTDWTEHAVKVAKEVEKLRMNVRARNN